jgi:2'-phosphotransferase
MANKKVEQSKYMSWVLRHGLKEVGLEPDESGYVKLNDFIKLSNQNYKLDEKIIMEIVSNCQKQRFSIKEVDNIKYIRANQGHSLNVSNQIKSDKLLVKLNKPIQGVFHGTYKTHLESIKTSGLNRMKRQHIHLAKGLDAASGKRHDNNLIVYVDMAKAMADGIEFFESANGVILTEGIEGILPAKYLSYAELVKGNPVPLQNNK